jgi:PASTA domain
MTSSRTKMRGGLAVIAAFGCALLASLSVAVAPAAAAEEGNAAPLRPVSEGGLSIPVITGPNAPEEYPVQYENLIQGVRFRQVSEQLIAVEYLGRGNADWKIEALPAYAADGAAVPTSIRLSGSEKGYVVTMIVHHRAGNPAAGGAPFVYPIQGSGREGGYFTGAVEVKPTPAAEPIAAAPLAPCKVPSLHGLSLKAAKARLRAAHCAIGTVRISAPITADTGKVVKQFRAAGTNFPGGTAVAVKLGSPGSR